MPDALQICRCVHRHKSLLTPLFQVKLTCLTHPAAHVLSIYINQHNALLPMKAYL